MTNYDNNYTLGLVVCHNGSIFMYAASEAINSDYYNLVVADYIKDGYNDYEAQIKAIIAAEKQRLFQEIKSKPTEKRFKKSGCKKNIVFNFG